MSACRNQEISGRSTGAPPFAVDLSGKALFLDGSATQKTLLFFWATWCPMCKEELAVFSLLYDELRAKNLEVFAVGFEEDAENIRRAAPGLRLPYPMLIDHGRKICERYEVGMVPIVMAVDSAGRILRIKDPKTGLPSERIEGYRDWAGAEGRQALFELAEPQTAAIRPTPESPQP